MRTALLAIASCVLVVGCSSGDTAEQANPSTSPTTSPSTSPTRAGSASGASETSSDPCALLSDREVEQLAGVAVGAARPGLTGGLANCQWTTSDGAFVQTIGSPSSSWAQALPDALRALEASGEFTDEENLAKLRAGAELVEAGQDLDPAEACSLFSDMVELQGQPEGSQSILTAVPDLEHAMAVSGQMCSQEHFTSVMIADEQALEQPLPMDRVATALRSAHRRNLDQAS